MDDEKTTPMPLTCNDCVFKFNELLGNEKPCCYCIRMSEFIPIDEETYQEGFWLDDPIICNKIMDCIDDICYRLEALDALIGKDIKARSSDLVYYLTSLKELIANEYIQSGGPCYKDKNERCGECKDDQCPF